MQPMTQPNLLQSRKVHFISIDDIVPNPMQPRRLFDMDALKELADSIRQYGILQPLSVRKLPRRYELVSGERRLRAARLAGLTKVPCLLVNINDRASSLLALIENLQRRDLDFFEEAEGIARLIDCYGLSQEEAAARLGKSQSAIANKLRLLKHPPTIITQIREHRLTERHARALLRVEEGSLRQEVLHKIIQHHWNVNQTERYIEHLCTYGKPLPHKRPTILVKDVRLFFNTIDRAVSMIRTAGISAAMQREDTDSDFVLTVTIPKKN